MTANPAATIRIEYVDSATPSLTLTTITVSQLPDVRFFASDVPTQAISSLAELDTNGNVILTVPYPPR